MCVCLWTERLLNVSGRDLRRALFSLKQIFQVCCVLVVAYDSSSSLVVVVLLLLWLLLFYCYRMTKTLCMSLCIMMVLSVSSSLVRRQTRIIKTTFYVVSMPLVNNFIILCSSVALRLTWMWLSLFLKPAISISTQSKFFSMCIVMDGYVVVCSLGSGDVVCGWNEWCHGS